MGMLLAGDCCCGRWQPVYQHMHDSAIAEQLLSTLPCCSFEWKCCSIITQQGVQEKCCTDAATCTMRGVGSITAVSAGAAVGELRAVRCLFAVRCMGPDVARRIIILLMVMQFHDECGCKAVTSWH